MTAVLSPASVTSTVRARRVDAPLSIQAADYTSLVDSGVVPVDIRPQHRRVCDGVLSGAIALDAAEVVDALTPGSSESLRSATTDSRWVLISDDGHDAEWLTWHLQARGVRNAVFVVGGFAALRTARVRGRISDDELATIAAHD